MWEHNFVSFCVLETEYFLSSAKFTLCKTTAHVVWEAIPGFITCLMSTSQSHGHLVIICVRGKCTCRHLTGVVWKQVHTLLSTRNHVNTYHAAGECRRRVKNLTNLVKNVKIVEFHSHIWNRHEKCIQISTNMPSIGLVIPEITCEMLEFWENKHNFA